ncbi:MAG: GHKL domain-containing protein [Eubacteriales bacterium]|nr:GHKL domain-containing protein [Eubacteriales bacterium]
MDVIEVLLSAVFNILGIYMNFRFISIFLEKRKLRHHLNVLVFFLVWIINWGIYFVYNQVLLTTGSIFLLLLIAAVILYEGSIVRKIFAICCTLAVSILVEDVVWRVFLWFDWLEKAEYMGSLVTSLVMIGIILILEHFMLRNKSQYISKESYYNIIIVFLGNIVLVHIIGRLAAWDKVESWIALCVIGLINMSTFFLYDKVNESYRNTIEKNVFEERVSMYAQQFEIMEQTQNNINGIRHDMKNHLHLISAYIEDGKYDAAKAYVSQIGDFMNVAGRFVDTGNRDVDMILNRMLQKAQDMDCKIETNIAIPKETFISGFDLNILLGNLLDNALEALKRTENRYLYVELIYRCNVLIVRVHNTYDGIVKKRGSTYLTRKQEKGCHGIGMKNISEVVKRYEGEQQIETDKEMFKVDIVLYLKSIDS